MKQAALNTIQYGMKCLTFADMENLRQVLFTVIQGAVEIPDPQGQKACFSILRRLVEVWADKENGLVGFSEFMYENIIPACFMAPLKPTFDLADAQTVLVSMLLYLTERKSPTG